MRALYIFLIAITFCGTSWGQNNGEKQWGAWYMYFGTNKVSETLSIHSEIQYRNYEVATNFNQLLLRTGLNYHFAENATATLGYGFISTDPTFTEPDGEKNISEHRIYQQFVLRNSLGKFKFSHRYRLEQRFIDNPITGNDTQHRARYLLRITYPISETWFLSGYDEVFINLQEPIFGQNRLYGAIGYKLTSAISVQFGYLKNHFTGAQFDRFQIGIWWNTDLRKKSSENLPK